MACHLSCLVRYSPWRRYAPASKPMEPRDTQRSSACDTGRRSCTRRPRLSRIVRLPSAWAKHREVALEDPSALVRVQQGAPTVAELIRWYIENFETVSKWQRSKQAHLEFLERHALGKLNALTLKVAELLDHVRSRRAKGTGPATVANDLVWLGVVLRAAKNIRELPVRPEIVQEAREACSELRLTGKARKRTRRPTADELARLREYFDAARQAFADPHAQRHGICAHIGAAGSRNLPPPVEGQR